MSLRKTAILVLAVMFLMLFISAGQAESSIAVYVNNKKISFPDQKPYINKDNRTLVPVRFVSEALGANVKWDEEIRMVTINQNGRTIKLRIGEKKANVNGREVVFDTRAIITPKNRTMVPLRFVSEALGADVRWAGNERAVYISISGEVSAGDTSTQEGMVWVYDADGKKLYLPISEVDPTGELNLKPGQEVIILPDGGGGMNTTEPDNSVEEIPWTN